MSTKGFFISYNRADCEWAEWISWQLEEKGYPVTIQAWDFGPGGNFVLDMQRAFEKYERIVAVLSPDYLTSEFAAAEWAVAFARDPDGAKGLLLPVRVRESELKGLMLSIVYIDLVGLDENKARDLLLAGVKRDRAKPSTAPIFPGSPSRVITRQPRFPGTLPPIWNIPHQRNPNFIGRDELLDELHRTLTSKQAAALHGLGGVGKTRLAVEYAYRFAADYTMVWWIRANEVATLTSDFVALATKLNLHEKDLQKLPEIVEAVREVLGSTGLWLIIFDNALDVKDLLNYLPQSQSGHVIITSQNPNWGGTVHRLEVKVLSRENSVGFLLRRAGQPDKTAANLLADELGDLPLALEQAGAYMAYTRRSLADYLELFQERQKEVLRRSQPASDYNATIASTWELACQEVQKASPAATELVNLCAFLAPDAIPQWIFRDHTDYLPSKLAEAIRDELKFDEAIAALWRYSLIQVDETTRNLSFHRLVQAVARHALAEEEQEQFAQAAVRVVNAAFPEESDDFRNRSLCEALLPHARTATNHGERLNVACPEIGRVLNQIGLYTMGHAEHEAAQLFERALRISKASYGEQHPYTAEILNNLGAVLSELYDVDRALWCLKQALRIDLATYGLQSKHVAAVLNNIGFLQLSIGNLVMARDCMESALWIDTKVFGAEHLNVAKRLNSLHLVLQNQGDLEGAKRRIQQALEIIKVAYDPEHPFVANCLNNLGLVLRDLGDGEGAKARFEEALGILRKSLGASHPNTMFVKENLESLGGG